MSRDITVSLLDINKSDFGFKPDAENNEILFGLKGANNVGDDLVHTIIANRPYTSLQDFVAKVNPNKQAMISLIKGGAFDKLEQIQRTKIMMKYLWMTCDAKKRITLQNFNGLIEAGLVPEEYDFERRVFNFNKFIKSFKLGGEYYLLNDIALKFYEENFDMDDVCLTSDGRVAIEQKIWNKIYTKKMDIVRDWMKNEQTKILETYNRHILMEQWKKYAAGSISTWEMESLCFYHSRHELSHVDRVKYGISNFGELPEEPVVDYTFKKNGIDIPIFKLNKIIGTCIDKNKTKSTVTILTTDGVVDVRFRPEYFALFDKQVSEKQHDGSKKIMERSWFNRGSMIMITGYRRGDQFVPKKYKSTATHQLYKIDEVAEDGAISLRSQRYGGSDE